MNRRKFLKAAVIAGISSSNIKQMTASNNILFAEMPVNNSVIMVDGTSPDKLFRKAISQLGGMSKFISKGDRVCIKPDISWNKSSELAANTNPDLISEIAKQCFISGAKEVLIFDHTIDNWKCCYTNSGIAQAAKESGATIINAHSKSDYLSLPLPMGKYINNVSVHRAIVECDKWINVPVLKHHGTLGYSAAKRNYMGIVWDRKQLRDNGIEKSIEDISTYTKKPILHIVDAYRVITKRGPKGGCATDTKLTKTLFISEDINAIEKESINFLNSIV